MSRDVLRGPLALLAVLTAARVAYGLQFQSVGAVGPAMVAELGLDYASLGTLVGAFSTLGIALSLPAGWLIARLGDRRVVLAGLGLMAAGASLLAAAPGFGAALAGRRLAGAGAAALIVALPTIVADRFSGAALPAALGALLAGYPLGVGIGFVALPLVPSWRAAVAATAVLAVAAFGAAALALPPPRMAAAGASGTRIGAGRGPRAREAAAIAAAGLVWGCPNAGFATLLGFAPVFFADRGMPADAAAALVSLVAFATVPTGPLGGWLLGRSARPARSIAGGLALIVGAIAVLALGIAPAAMLVGAGVALGTVAGPIVALPAAALAPERRAMGMGMGVFWLLFFASMTVLPPLAGLARDLTGDPAAPLGAAAAFVALGLAALAAHLALRGPESTPAASRRGGR
ncbi:MAG: MFS transporter [Acetobacteraceae bacterium]|nr:MFS transporter [Acetobacteraceae bacterium]